MARIKAKGDVIFTEEKWEKVNPENKELLDDFMMELMATRKSPNTVKAYCMDLKFFFAYILDYKNNKSVLELSKKDFRQFSLWLLDRDCSNARVNRVIASIKALLRFAEDSEDFEYEISKAMRIKNLPKEPVKEIIFITDQQVHKLRERLREMKLYGYMALLDMAYDSAARRNELRQVLKDGILDKNYTNTVKGKRGKLFKIIYHDNTLESLKLYLDQRGEDDIPELWVTGNGVFRRPVSYGAMHDWFVKMSEVLSEIEGREISFSAHSFRHSSLQAYSDGSHYVCRRLNKEGGFSLSELKLLAHHENIDMTEAYLRNRDEELIGEMFGIKMEE